MPTIDRDDLLDTLTEGIEGLTTSEAWRAHLDVQRRFHRYSFSNSLLICAQDPARQPGGRIRHLEEAGPVGAEGRAGHLDPGADGRPALATPTTATSAGPSSASARYRSSTCPRPRVTPFPRSAGRSGGDDPGAWLARLTACAGDLGYTVERTELPGATHGDCTFALRRIRVECRNERAQQVKTLAHELAHALLHEGVDDRPLAELEAESTAYVVCRTLGFDTGVYSFGYVACWAGGGPEAVGPDQGVGQPDPAGRRRHPRFARGERRTGRGRGQPREVARSAVRLARSYERAISSQAASTPSNPRTSVRLCGSRSL